MSRKPARPAAMKERFYSVEEIADALGVSGKTVRRRIADGALAYHRIGRQVWITDQDFDAYVALQRRRVAAR